MDASLLVSPAEKLSKLTYYILVETQADGKVSATVWNFPECRGEGATREEALKNLSQSLIKRLEKVEIVEMELELPQPEHPWMKFAGVFKDDPDFDKVQEHIEAYRRELDAEMEEYYRQLDAESQEEDSAK